METVWTFKTARFTVVLMVSEIPGYQYDGDDEDGSTQAALDSGEMVAFDSHVAVELDGVAIGEDHLGGSVYYRDTVSGFWTDHRDRDPMNRNCSEMRAARGNVAICHYFPEMVRLAIAEARSHLCDLPRINCRAA